MNNPHPQKISHVQTSAFAAQTQPLLTTVESGNAAEPDNTASGKASSVHRPVLSHREAVRQAMLRTG